MFDNLTVTEHYIKAEKKAAIITSALAASSLDGGAPLKVIYDASVIVSMITEYTNLSENEEAMAMSLGELFDELNISGAPHRVFMTVAELGLSTLGFDDAKEMLAYAEKAYDDANNYSNSIGAVLAPISQLFAPFAELASDDNLQRLLSEIKDSVQNTTDEDKN